MTFYHGTHSDALPSIKTTGLRGPVVYLTEDMGTAEQYAVLRSKTFGDSPALVYVDIDYALLENDPNSDDDRLAYRTMGSIPASGITYCEILNSL